MRSRTTPQHQHILQSELISYWLTKLWRGSSVTQCLQYTDLVAITESLHGILCRRVPHSPIFIDFKSALQVIFNLRNNNPHFQLVHTSRARYIDAVNSVQHLTHQWVPGRREVGRNLAANRAGNSPHDEQPTLTVLSSRSNVVNLVRRMGSLVFLSLQSDPWNNFHFKI